MTYKFDIGGPAWCWSRRYKNDSDFLTNHFILSLKEEPIFKWLDKHTPNYKLSTSFPHECGRGSILFDENINQIVKHLPAKEDHDHKYVMVEFEDKNDAMFFSLHWEGRVKEGWNS